MRKLIKRSAYRLGCWLADQASRLEWIAEDLQDWGREPQERSPGFLGDIVATTMANRAARLGGALSTNNALLNRLANKRNG